MSDQEPDKEQRPPSQDELQQRARHVWGVLKFFFSGIFLIALLIVGVVGYWLFHAFGLGGLVVGLVLLGIGFFFVCRHLMTY